MSRPLTVTFRAGTTGAWQIRSIAAIRGPSLAPAPRLAMDSGAPGPGTATWQLRGVVSNPRYTTAAEMQALKDAQGTDAAKLYLTGMIKHHEGAINMARDEIKNGKFPEEIELAKSIESSQQKEIDTMKQILASL